MQDHLGNNRIVADAAASVKQSTHYYPFGMPFADATGKDIQPYKYNGKELDTRNGLNMYDYGARYLAMDIPVMPTPDPHAEKYYPMSPYAYVGNNPINRIDPTGIDSISINNDGRINYRKGGESDVINVTNGKGEVVSKTYELGTLKGGEQTKGYTGSDYAYIQINNTENSKSIFEFIADNTGVEWSNSSFLNPDNSTSHYLTTSHSDYVEGGFSLFIIDKLLNNLLTHDHSHPYLPHDPRANHPDKVNLPSGLVGSGITGDVDFARSYINDFLLKKSTTIPQFRIYVPKRGYRRYNMGSTDAVFRKIPNSYYEK